MFIATEAPILSVANLDPIVDESRVIPLGKVDVLKVLESVPPVTLIILAVDLPDVVAT